ncbi:MAG TPA: Ohr family peroxiredoxin [Candidatus Binatia bacterium]|nr:Ohr family peroxiredoxin [Candidatus Binatia bacterium]
MNAINPANSKVLFTGKTHTSAGKDGATRSADGFLDVKLPQPHPAAENFFAAAWSACYLGAVELAAATRKVKLAGSPSVDTEIDLNHAGGTTFFLKARLSVSIPGVDRATAEELATAAHGICPYSKAVHGNIDVTTTVI